MRLMQPILALLIGVGLLAPQLPLVTSCQGTMGCCCARGAAEALAATRLAATGLADPEGGSAPRSSRPAAAFGRRCPCAPEMRGCPSDRDPGTLPGSPPPTALLGPPPLPAPGPAFVHHSPPAARIPAPSAEPPPLLPPAALSGILRI
jgi:hypothetical protein